MTSSEVGSPVLSELPPFAKQTIVSYLTGLWSVELAHFLRQTTTRDLIAMHNDSARTSLLQTKLNPPSRNAHSLVLQAAKGMHMIEF